jgi:ADP-ribosylglycohydrolase
MINLTFLIANKLTAMLCAGILFFGGYKGYQWYYPKPMGMPTILPSSVKNSSALSSHKPGLPITVAPMLPPKDLERLKELLNRPINKQSTLEQTRGALFGGALGDIFGRDLERINNPPMIGDKYRPYSLLLQTLKPRISKNPTQHFTDDTLMALAVLEGCLSTMNAPQNDTIIAAIANNLIHSIKENDKLFGIRYHGGTNSFNLVEVERRRNKKVQHWFDFSNAIVDINTTGGCGSIMRAWPIGLLYAHDQQRMLELAAAQSRITHPLKMAQESCQCMCAAVAALYSGKSIHHAFEAMISVLSEKPIESEYAPVVHLESFMHSSQGISDMQARIIANKLSLLDMLRYAYAAAIDGYPPYFILGRENRKHPTHSRSESGALLGWAADEALCAAWYVFVYIFLHGEELHKSISEKNKPKVSTLWHTVQVGAWTPGDSDSIAALAGVFAGLVYGWTRQVPTSEKGHVQYIERYKDIETLASRVAEITEKHREMRNRAP